VFQKALFVFQTIVNFFIHRFAILSAGEPAKVCQTRHLYFRQFSHAGRFA
jgi:hypothetical protein